MSKGKNGLNFELENAELQELSCKVYEGTMNGANELLKCASMISSRDDLLTWARAVKAHFDEHQELIIAIRVLNANLLSDKKEGEKA